MKNQRTKGIFYEKIAQDYLQKSDFKVIEKNWRASRKSEIDLICLKEKTLVFVEVKGRSSSLFGKEDVFKAVNQIKLERILLGINSYLQKISEKDFLLNYDSYRLDLVLVWGKANKIEHLENLDFL